MSKAEEAVSLSKGDLGALLRELANRGYEVHGLVERDGATVFDQVEDVSDLVAGKRDVQAPGYYRLHAGEDDEIFGVANGPTSLKPFVFRSEERLLEIKKESRKLSFTDCLPTPRKIAVIGVRACDLAALAIQDRVFLGDHARDAHYAAHRENLLLVAVNCTRPASTCFCHSMDTGPYATSGYDIALTELADAFLATAATPTGREILEHLPTRSADSEQLRNADAGRDRCIAAMERRLDAGRVKDLLYAQHASKHWDDVGDRCLSCANCTMVCPTCFCHNVTEVSDITGGTKARVRTWDSCFSIEHAHVHGKNFRPHTRDRYRQWLTHKLATWHEQYGLSGCVGCGRCITWCPVGIDLTREVEALRQASTEGTP